MAIIVDDDAGTITFTDCAITFPYAMNVSTGVGTITITPAGGVASFPLAIQGESGLPPLISIVMHEVGPDDDLPAINPVLSVLAPGGPGEAASYQYDMFVHQGQTGPPGAFALGDATDLTGTGIARYMVVVNDTETGFTYAPQKVGDLFWPGAISSTASSNTSPRLLATVTVPPQLFAWRPVVHGYCVVTGSIDTRVDLVARLGDPDIGDEVGRAPGQAGAAPPPLSLIAAPPPGSDVSYGKVAAGVEGNVFLRAEQQAASANNWSTNSGSTRFSVEVLQVP